MIRFIEVVEEQKGAAPSFILAEVWINENYVVSVREAREYKSLLKEGLLPSDLNSDHSFTTVVTTNGPVTEAYVVVGSPTAVATRFQGPTRTLLKG
jgi:hypothetical protein